MFLFHHGILGVSVGASFRHVKILLKLSLLGPNFDVDNLNLDDFSEGLEDGFTLLVLEEEIVDGSLHLLVAALEHRVDEVEDMEQHLGVDALGVLADDQEYHLGGAQLIEMLLQFNDLDGILLLLDDLPHDFQEGHYC